MQRECAAFAERHAACVSFVTHDAHAALLAAPLRAAGVRLVGLRRAHVVACSALRALQRADSHAPH